MNLLHTWRMVPDPARPNGFRMEDTALPMPACGPGEALVRVTGCGICGTDLGYFWDRIPTSCQPPLTLGHEVSGVVATGRSELIGRPVIVPTIFPCRRCEPCLSGRANRCLRQKMLGGNFEQQGGFSSHVLVPEVDLCLIPPDAPVPTERLAVVADAVSTPFQACRRAGIAPGDKVIVIGATGGLGIYAVQWARLLGARVVVGIARAAHRLSLMKDHGIDLAIPVGSGDSQFIRREIWRHCKACDVNPRQGWKILELSGTAEGQRLGLELLTYASRLVLVGYTDAEIGYRFSRLMALDAEICGSWGCDPRLYPEVLSHVLSGRISVLAFTETRPMNSIQESFAELRGSRKSLARLILTPDW
jgi:6-hydroxycyclohex-1-ene-1-carbonyl-CoA dehydrogenase